jgi:hypothetical protein
MQRGSRALDWNAKDEATQRRRTRNAMKQCGQPQVILAYAAVVSAFLGSGLELKIED